ncbi:MULTISPECIES: ABC transporter substrate-binding protein [unclassified Shinella]|uniref:ABC transporter substrate-binding protein n=1 Tax=unclassified Shinella TaxID=2643062 RepID=UPI00225C645C|nr:MULTISPECIES: ABC transporter substrate-binding protein [unclassified Shinella]MCO5141212.1 ABC transporter substrate-binding protein [Shinella sp.]MDC7260070.1 ABC transporter substrate-binding protein [Shinella sp. YE25]CAI0341609.1 ABC transporter substrate-binding protein [Rhizobiaceae bacterium]CAK7261237.1 polar amino acid transport system substrate-binding protein [Shinella sp. WSC3-e]
MQKAILAASACLFAMTAHAQDLPEKYKTAGKLIVANTPNYPPMEYRDPATNELVGVDIDLGKALAKQLDTEIEWSEIGFEQMVSSLNTGRVDLVLSGMSDLPARRETMDFVDYMRSGAQFYTSAKRKDEFKTLTDFCGKTVGMSRRTSFPDEAAKWSAANCEANGKPALNIVGTEGSADARTQLKQGRLDGAVQGSETLPYLLTLEKDTYAIVGEPFTEVYQGIGFSKQTPELRDAIAGALKAIMASGEYKAIFEKYDLAGSTLDGVMINGEAAK